MKPILKYPGAKWRLSEWITRNMPPHESYLEPFFGSGAVLFNKPKSRIETVSDLDGDIVHFFKVCRERADELAFALSLTPWSREEYMAADNRSDLDDLERARRFCVRCWMSIGGKRLKSGWRCTTGKQKDGGPDNAKLWGRLPEIVHQVAGRLIGVQIENRPAVDVIQTYQGEEVLVYADPPYLKETRTAHGDMYLHEMTDEEHVGLLRCLREHPGPAMISGYDCELYNDMLAGWHKVTTDTQAERGARRTEVLWMNKKPLQHDSGQLKLW
ncbi:MAG: DNA adenine methylase [Oscillospiraceae bacterium]